MSLIRLEEIKKNGQVRAYLEKANEYLGAIGYTEHGERHANLVASIARNIFLHLGSKEREQELVAIAGYLHDIGNVVNRDRHAQIGALLAFEILRDLGMPAEEVAVIIGAIGNHEEENGDPISRVSAALILADKSDVHRSRVRNPKMVTFDIHDRVNYAAEHSFLRVNGGKKVISLELTIDTKISQVMEYFEIFLSRMMACRRAAKVLDCTFELMINNTKLL